MSTVLKRLELTSAGLHILAMVFMLCDHMWSTLFPSQVWLTCIGRIAFPLFAFTTAEGYFHTRDFKKYVLRMLIAALLSEIPFDLMYEGTAFYPFHQNVIWTFLLALLCMKLMDRIRAKGKWWISIPCCAFVVLAAYIAGGILGVDYYGSGIWIVFLFYFFRQRKWWSYLAQFAGMYYINMELLGGYYYDVTWFGMHLELVRQNFALIALLPIWLYRGTQGCHTKAFRNFCYAFYAVHMAVLVFLGWLSMQFLGR